MTGRNGAQVLVQTLIDQGIDTVFGYPGGTVLDIYDALYDRADEIHHIETTHEQHACHAADGYSRATGKTGVVIATSGPGATNLVTGIATAYLDSIPLVAITGNVSNAMIGTDAFQELDITGVTLPITKHNYFVRDGPSSSTSPRTSRPRRAPTRSCPRSASRAARRRATTSSSAPRRPSTPPGVRSSTSAAAPSPPARVPRSWPSPRRSAPRSAARSWASRPSRPTRRDFSACRACTATTPRPRP